MARSKSLIREKAPTVAAYTGDSLPYPDGNDSKKDKVKPLNLSSSSFCSARNMMRPDCQRWYISIALVACLERDAEPAEEEPVHEQSVRTDIRDERMGRRIG
jgi:hypothetical protein